MKKFSILLLIVTSFGLWSCNNDLDILAPYKETCIVYGLINAADSVQYVRINRAFLGEEDAYVMAQHPDSFNYPDILDVTFERWESGIKKDSYLLERDSSFTLEPGIFANTPNILYKTPASKLIQQNSDYKLNIYNRVTGETTSSMAAALNDITVTVPVVFQGSTITVPLYNSAPYKVKFTPNEEAAVYNLTIKFNYTEFPNGNPTNFVYKSVDWNLGNIPNSSNGGNIEIELPGDDLFQLLGSSIPLDNSVNRRFSSLTFIFSSGAEDFYTYIQVNEPPSGLVQSIPDYTNIENGKGIFSSRYIKKIEGGNFDSKCLDSLKNGRFTKNLRFI